MEFRVKLKICMRKTNKQTTQNPHKSNKMKKKKYNTETKKHNQ